MTATRLPVTIAAAAAFTLSATALAGPQSAASRPRITGIHHVSFRVSDAGATGKFYGEMLGLPRRTGEARLVYTIGSRQHVVLEPGLRADEDERLLHLAFDTTDVAALAAHLRSQGIEVQPANDCEKGAIRVSDPDEHTIEFVQSRWPPDARQAESSRALSIRLLHAGLTIRDEPAAHRFYRDTLGFSEIWRGGRKAGVTQWVNMRVPDGTDYLEYMLVNAPPDRRQRGVLHHIALVVPDIQAAWEEVGRRTPEAARPSLSRPQVGVNGRWQLNLFDPDGTRAELMEPFTVR